MTSSSTPPIDPLSNLIAAIHDTPTRVALAITGGGSAALSRLLTVPGASRTVLEGQVPYAASALTEYLGSPPDRFCDDSTALAMAPENADALNVAGLVSHTKADFASTRAAFNRVLAAD